MKPTEMCTGQKVTIFRHHPNKYFCINDKVGQIGTIMNVFCYDGTDFWYAVVQLEDDYINWFPVEMLELTPTPDQIKVGTRIQVADSNLQPCLDYAGVYGTITKPLYGVDDNIEMLPDDQSLRDKWGTITLSGLNRFRILEQPPKESPTFYNIYVSMEIQPKYNDNISYKLHIDGDMKSSNLRDQIKEFIDKVEEDA